MGQSVSTSQVVASFSVRRHREGRRQCFIEDGDTFIPLVKTSYTYEFTLAVPQGSELQIFSLEGQLVQQLGLSTSSSVCSISVDDLSSLETGKYRARLFDIAVVVFLENESAPTRLPSFSNDLDHWLPDSIEFRQYLSGMESDLQHLQKGAIWRIFLDSLSKVHDSLSQLSQHLSNVTKLPLPVLSRPNPLVQLINTELFNRLQSFRRVQIDPFGKNLLNYVISPLQDFIQYNTQNQKILARNQKTFNELTKSFYINPSQSLPPLNLKKDFELSRLDYYDFIFQSLFNGLPLRKFSNSILLFLYDHRLDESEFNLSYIPKVNMLRSSIKKSKSFKDLNSLYSNSKNYPNFKEDIVMIRYLKQNGASTDASNNNDSGGNSSSTNHWHRQWITLNDHILQFYSNSKKLQNSGSSPFHQINLSFACIKKVNPKTLEVITTGSSISVPVPTPTTAAPNASATATAISNEDFGTPVRFLLQLNNENELNSWLGVLKQQQVHDLNDSTKSINTDVSVNSSKIEATSLLDIVRNEHESNLRCCDCGSTESVEWISINLLCVVCIKCSGVHRSMGSHISKIRSLTLDNFTSPEILLLIQNNVSNANINSIYESSLFLKEKIVPNSTDSERAQYVINKYQLKKFVDDGSQTANKSLKALIKAIHLNSVYMLQKCIAQSRASLKDVIEDEKTGTVSALSPSIFQYSLKHHEMVSGSPIFYITEFLLINGMPMDKLPSDSSHWAPSVINYWKSKLEIYGTYRPISLDKQENENLLVKSSNPRSQLPTLSIPHEKSSKRWSLNPIPTSAQLKSPTNLLTMHKSLKLSKRGVNNHKE